METKIKKLLETIIENQELIMNHLKIEKPKKEIKSPDHKYSGGKSKSSNGWDIKP